MNKKLYPRNFIYVNETLAIGLFLKTTENSDYMPIVSRWNQATGGIKPMKYLKHPEIERKRTCFAASVENGLYVEGYWYHDLITIGYLNGDFKCNIYGSKWDNSTSNINGYYENIQFCKDKIIASYLGGKRIYLDENGGQHAIYPTKFLIFDKEGHYIQTLETRHPTTVFCYDPENNRIIMTLADDMLFGYLDLAGII